MEGAAGLGGLRQTAPNRDLLHVFQKTGAGVCVCVLHGYLLKKPLVGREVRTHRGP